MFLEECSRENSQNYVTNIEKEEASLTHVTVSTLCGENGRESGEKVQIQMS